MSTIHFQGVEDTLFIPLAARVLASRRFPHYFYDAKAFCKTEGIDLILARGFFAEARKQLKGLKLYTKIAMKVVEDKKRCLLLQVKL